MIQNLSSAMEADQDLHIAKHVEPENLPAMIQPIMLLAQSDGERDMLLLSLLPAEFESKTLVAEAASQGISRRTALRWNDTWQEQGLVQQIKYGTYKKCMTHLA